MRLKVAAILLIGLVWKVDMAWACEYCMGTGDASGPTVRALFYSMASLLSVVTCVGVGIGMFFFKLHKRGRILDAPSQGIAVDSSGTLVSEDDQTDNHLIT